MKCIPAHTTTLKAGWHYSTVMSETMEFKFKFCPFLLHDADFLSSVPLSI